MSILSALRPVCSQPSAFPNASGFHDLHRGTSLTTFLMSSLRPPTLWRALYLSLHIWSSDGVFESLGYIHKSRMEHLPLPEDQYIRGFEVALDMRGIREIAAITEEGTTSSWAQDPAGYPRKRITDVEGISLIVAGFDALKLVSLSRDRVTKRLQDGRDRLLWYLENPAP
ncbi:hypothetical protein DER46DRAFT_2764 [Fusarium sp. MPI-SDFR-AT-0072]|nr:hypothetical protein DER46DRAFT_2764 [Fusarium sp. MPI-SDFR-AT-0072]